MAAVATNPPELAPNCCGLSQTPRNGPQAPWNRPQTPWNWPQSAVECPNSPETGLRPPRIGWKMPCISQNRPQISQTNSKLPRISPKHPKLIANHPESALICPKSPRIIPKLLWISPKSTQICPKLPQISPNLPQKAPNSTQPWLVEGRGEVCVRGGPSAVYWGGEYKEGEVWGAPSLNWERFGGAQGGSALLGPGPRCPPRHGAVGAAPGPPPAEEGRRAPGGLHPPQLLPWGGGYWGGI